VETEECHTILIEELKKIKENTKELEEFTKRIIEEVKADE